MGNVHLFVDFIITGTPYSYQKSKCSINLQKKLQFLSRYPLGQCSDKLRNRAQNVVHMALIVQLVVTNLINVGNPVGIVIGTKNGVAIVG